MTGWRARPSRPDDTPALLAMFAESFNRQVSAAHYEWKLRTRQSPVENVAIAVDDADQPVFHMAGIPCRCRLAGEERRIMVAVDGMTRPTHRRLGILTTVAAQLFARWRDAGVALVLGLPNEQWRSRIAALQWRPLFPLRWLVRPTAPARLAARRLGWPRLGHLPLVDRWWSARYRRPVPGIAVEESPDPAAFQRLWAAVGGRFANALVRDPEWMAWRYRQAPEAGYRVAVATRRGMPVGAAAFRLRGTTGLLADVFTGPGDDGAARALVSHAVLALQADGALGVRTLAAPGTWSDGVLRRLGFFASRHAFPVHAVLLDPHLDAAALRAPVSWHLAGGDFDVV